MPRSAVPTLRAERVLRMARALGPPLRGASPSGQGDDPPRLSGAPSATTRSRTSTRTRGSGRCAPWSESTTELSDEEVRKYVLTAVANHASKELRRRSRRPTAPLEAVHAVADDRRLPDERAAKLEDSRITRDLLASLPPRRRAVMLLRYGWGLEPTPGLRAGQGPLAAGVSQGDHPRRRRADREAAAGRARRVVRGPRARAEGVRGGARRRRPAAPGASSTSRTAATAPSSSASSAATSTTSAHPSRCPARWTGSSTAALACGPGGRS